MSFDLTALGITEAVPTTDWDGFQGEAPVLPAESSRGPALLKGLYILRAPAFQVTADRNAPFRPVPNKNGKMQFLMQPEVVRPEAFAGRTIYSFYVPIIKSEKQKFSRAMELVIATGLFPQHQPKTDEDWIQAAFDIGNKEFGARVDLRVRDGGQEGSGKVYFESQDLLYKRQDGSPKLSYVIDKGTLEIIFKEGDDEATRMLEQQAIDQGTGRRIYANAEIKRLVSLEEAIKALDTAAANQ